MRRIEVMSVRDTSGRFLLALVSGAVLSACSPSASTAVPPVETAAQSSALLPVAAQAQTVATPPAAAAPVQPLVTGLPDFTRLVEAYGPAVVNVRVQARAQARSTRGLEQLIPGLPGFEFRLDPREPTPQSGEGSGFIVSPDGYILTNAHVVAGVEEVVVRLSDRRELEAEVVGSDTRTDVAVIKVEARNLPTVRIGDPSQLKPGQWVVAIGSPFGMQNSVTAGIVSATSRDLPQDQYVPFIQTDAAVNPGNSGGPLFNLQGEVVGINSQIYSQNGGYMGLSFAIPIDIADNIRDQLVSTGRVTRSKIGLAYESVDASDAEAWGLDRPRGAIVQTVEENGPADKAGIRPGDIILSVDGKPVEGTSSLPAMISTLKPGTATQLEVWRDRKLQKVTARVVELEEPGQPTAADRSRIRPLPRGAEPPVEETALGLAVRPLTAEEKRLVQTDGVLVIERVSGAAEERLRPGDIILDVAGTPVKSVGELQSLVKSASGRFVPLRIQRGEQIGYEAIRKQ
jgi:serine protease Do